MSLGTILLIIVVLALVGALPNWGYSSGWGYGPSGVLGVVVLIILVLVLISTDQSRLRLAAPAGLGQMFRPPA